jgi:hypothetical protein
LTSGAPGQETENVIDVDRGERCENRDGKLFEYAPIYEQILEDLRANLDLTYKITAATAE